MKETRFIYKHKESKKWMIINTFSVDWMVGNIYGYSLVEDLPTDNLYKARNIIEEDFIGCLKGEKNYFYDDFELVEIEVEYKIDPPKFKIGEIIHWRYTEEFLKDFPKTRNPYWCKSQFAVFDGTNFVDTYWPNIREHADDHYQFSPNLIGIKYEMENFFKIK